MNHGAELKQQHKPVEADVNKSMNEVTSMAFMAEVKEITVRVEDRR